MAEEGTPPAAAELLAELNGMKLRALQARAEELGVDDDKLEDAEEKPEVIALIVAKLDEQAADAEAERVEAIKAELGGMKLRALQRRAVEVGVPEEKLDDAEEKSEVIELIMAKERGESAAAPVSAGPHGGGASNTEAMAGTMHSIFKQWLAQGLHIMFSYQWDVR